VCEFGLARNGVVFNPSSVIGLIDLDLVENSAIPLNGFSEDVMIGNQKVLAVIAARGGSKGLPAKNVADLGGKPLIAWSIAAARGSQLVDRTILTSDDPNIAAAAKSVGCDVPFVRPASLATDDASMVDVLLHAIDALPDKYGYVALLQATSPFRTPKDIDDCVRICYETGAPTVVTVSAAEKHPYWMFQMQADGRLCPFGSWSDLSLRRQQLSPACCVNGAVYVVQADWFRQNRAFYSPQTIGIMIPKERAVDIDTQFDLTLARALLP
jgi:CMP-N,N'-diacetyllegionaminic acid synthase